MTNKTPKIAIIIPTYNCYKFVIEAINSVRKQDYEGKVKLIVVDNESKDGTWELLKDEFEYYCDFVLSDAENIYKYSWHEPTREGLEFLDDCEYFMFMAADDTLEPSFVSNCMKLIQKAPDKIKAMQSPVKFFGKWNHTQTHQYSNLEEFKQQMLVRSVVNTPTIIWHRSFYDEGLMNLTEPEKYFGADDYAFYCELATRGHFIYPSPVWLGYNYRIHEDNTSWSMHKELNSVTTIDKEIQEKYRKIWIQDAQKV